MQSSNQSHATRWGQWRLAPVGWVVLCLAAVTASFGETPAADSPAAPEFGVMANSNDMRGMAAEELAEMMRAAGYRSVALSCSAAQLRPMVKAYRNADIRIGAVYVGWTTDGETGSFNMSIQEVLDLLQGTGAVIMLHVHTAKGTTVDDERIASQLRPLAEQAQAAGVVVALYPHTGFRVATTKQAVEIAHRVDHPALGVCFNLCHFLKQNDAARLPAVLGSAQGHLTLVTINGADRGDTQSMGWDRLIQPLGEGSFDVAELVRLLCVELGYDGPFFVQCYNVKTPAESLLPQTLREWRQMASACR